MTILIASIFILSTVVDIAFLLEAGIRLSKTATIFINHYEYE